MSCYLFMMVRVSNREIAAVDVQKVLTEHGCSVRMRLGLHDQGADNTCMPSGVLILQLSCEKTVAEKMREKLNSIEGVCAQLVDLA